MTYHTWGRHQHVVRPFCTNGPQDLLRSRDRNEFRDSAMDRARRLVENKRRGSRQAGPRPAPPSTSPTPRPSARCWKKKERGPDMKKDRATRPGRFLRNMRREACEGANQPLAGPSAALATMACAGAAPPPRPGDRGRDRAHRRDSMVCRLVVDLSSPAPRRYVFDNPIMDRRAGEFRPRRWRWRARRPVAPRRAHAADDSRQLPGARREDIWLGALASLVLIAFVLEILVPAHGRQIQQSFRDADHVVDFRRLPRPRRSWSGRRRRRW